MIAFLSGRMAGCTHDTAFIDVQGVGYALGMPATDLAKLPEQGEPVTVFTYMAVREDAVALYGFLTQEAKALFMRLISVSGIGPKVACAALSAFKPEEPYCGHSVARHQSGFHNSGCRKENGAAHDFRVEGKSCQRIG